MNDQLTRTLAEKAERFAQQHPADLSVDGVLARAGEIRRGRRMRATMAMAAVVLAVAVPVGITVLGQDDEAKLPTPAPPGDTSSIHLGDLPKGAEPATGSAEPGDPAGTVMVSSPHTPARDFHTAIDAHLDGKASSQIVDVAFVRRGFVVAYSDGDTAERTALFYGDDDSGKPQRWPLDSGFVVSPEKNVVAFTEPDGTVVAVQDGGSRWFEVGKVPGAGLKPAGILGENCSGRSEEPGCRIYVVGSDDQGPTTYMIAPHVQAQAMSEIRGLSDISAEGVAAGLVSVSDTGSCSEVRDAENVSLWRTCEHRLLSFSPDGRYLLASAAYADGFGDTELAVLDARTGKEALLLHTARDAAITRMVWEDADHVLATVFQKNQWAVIRIGVDGRREYALGPVAGSDVMAPFLTPAR